MGIFSFLDWNILATFSGAVGLTVIIVQMLKLPIDRVWKIPTRYLVYLVCLGVMLLAQVFIGNALTVQTVAMTALNAVLGTLTAMSLYTQIIELPEKQKLLNAYQYMMTGQVLDDADSDTEKNETSKAVKATGNGEDEPPDSDNSQS